MKEIKAAQRIVEHRFEIIGESVRFISKLPFYYYIDLALIELFYPACCYPNVNLLLGTLSSLPTPPFRKLRCNKAR